MGACESTCCHQRTNLRNNKNSVTPAHPYIHCTDSLSAVELSIRDAMREAKVLCFQDYQGFVDPGGSYNGYVTSLFTNSSAAKRETASISTKFESAQGTVSPGAGANTGQNQQSSESLESVKAGFQATGWNAKLTPQICAHSPLC